MTTLVNGSKITFSVIPDTNTVTDCTFQVMQSGTMTDANFTNSFAVDVAAACAASSGHYVYNAGIITAKAGTITPLDIVRTVSSVPVSYAGYAITVKPGAGVEIYQATSAIVHGNPVLPTVPTIRGANVSGLEFGTGTPTQAGLWPPLTDIDFYAARGFNVIRLPFKKARVQNGIYGPLDIVGNGTGDAERVKTLVDYITITKGMYCIIESHDSANFRTGQKVGSEVFPVAAFEDFWIKLINYLGKDNNKLIFNLENEPGGITANQWMRVCNSVTAAIRANGCTQQIQVPGVDFTGAHSWVSSGNSTAMLNYQDVINNHVFEVHQYLNDSKSGTSWECTIGGGSSRMAPFVNWCIANNKKGFVGEFGGDPDSDAQCGPELTALLDAMNIPQIIGWTAWGGGKHWGPTYPLRLQNDETTPHAAIMNILLSKLS